MMAEKLATIASPSEGKTAVGNVPSSSSTISSSQQRTDNCLTLSAAEPLTLSNNSSQTEEDEEEILIGGASEEGVRSCSTTSSVRATEKAIQCEPVIVSGPRRDDDGGEAAPQRFIRSHLRRQHPQQRHHPNHRPTPLAMASSSAGFLVGLMENEAACSSGGAKGEEGRAEFPTLRTRGNKRMMVNPTTGSRVGRRNPRPSSGSCTSLPQRLEAYQRSLRRGHAPTPPPIPCEEEEEDEDDDLAGARRPCLAATHHSDVRGLAAARSGTERHAADQQMVSSSSLLLSCMTMTTQRHLEVPAVRGQTKPSASTRNQPYVVGVMAHCGIIYEAVAETLVKRYGWARANVFQPAGSEELKVRVGCSESAVPASSSVFHLLLAPRGAAKRVIDARRHAFQREGRNSRVGAAPMHSRVGSSSGADGRQLVINSIPSMRSITLKCSMIQTLLRYHNGWGTLGAYVPRTYCIASKVCGACEDDRVLLLREAKRAVLRNSGSPPLWIAKSSGGCHGDDIRIFRGDPEGVQQLFDFVDTVGSTKPSNKKSKWVAQRYVDHPLLFHRRKFDLRCLALLRGSDRSIYVHQAYVMRLSSVPYSRETAASENPRDRFAHITNHCVQEEAEGFEAHEEQNELWRQHLDGLVRYKGRKLREAAAAGQEKERQHQNRRTTGTRREMTPMSMMMIPSEDDDDDVRTNTELVGNEVGTSNHDTPDSRDTNNNEYLSFDAFPSAPSAVPRAETMEDPTLKNTIMPQIHYIIQQTLLAGLSEGKAEAPSSQAFQLFGYDFILDESLHVWLLEINGSPGIAARLVETVAEDIIQVAVEPQFPSSSLGGKGTAKKRSPQKQQSSQTGFLQIYPSQLLEEE